MNLTLTARKHDLPDSPTSRSSSRRGAAGICSRPLRFPSALEQADVDVEVIVSTTVRRTRQRRAWRSSTTRGCGSYATRRRTASPSPGMRGSRRPAAAGQLPRRRRPLGAAKLRKQIDSAEAAGAVFAYSAGGGLDAARKFLFAVAPPDPATVTERLLQWNVIWCGCSNVLARADVVAELGGFDEQLVQLADWDLWIRLALAGRAAATSEVLVGYVMHDESMLLTDRRDFPGDGLPRREARPRSENGVSPDRRSSPAGSRAAIGSRPQARGGADLPAGCQEIRRRRSIPRALGALVPEPWSRSPGASLERPPILEAAARFRNRTGSRAFAEACRRGANARIAAHGTSATRIAYRSWSCGSSWRAFMGSERNRYLHAHPGRRACKGGPRGAPDRPHGRCSSGARRGRRSLRASAAAPPPAEETRTHRGLR